MEESKSIFGGKGNFQFSSNQKRILIISIIILIMLLMARFTPIWNHNVRYYSDDGYEGRQYSYVYTYGRIIKPAWFDLQEDGYHLMEVHDTIWDDYQSIFWYLGNSNPEFGDKEAWDFDFTLALIDMLLIVSILFIIGFLIKFLFSIKKKNMSKLLIYLSILMSIIVWAIPIMTSSLSYWYRNSFSGERIVTEYENEIWGPTFGFYFMIIAAILSTIMTVLLIWKWKELKNEIEVKAIG